VSWLWRPVGKPADIGWGDIGLAALLSVWAILLVTGAFPGSTDHAGALAAIGVLAMTVPVVWERRAPATAAVIVGVGAAANALIIGPLVRCGPGLPAALVIAYFAGTRLDRRKFAIAALFCAGSVITQAFYDPPCACATPSFASNGSKPRGSRSRPTGPGLPETSAASCVSGSRQSPMPPPPVAS
jgi:hypothetical protein